MMLNDNAIFGHMTDMYFTDQKRCLLRSGNIEERKALMNFFFQGDLLVKVLR